MAIESIAAFGKSDIYNELLGTQTSAVADNSEMSMDDFWHLMAAQLQYQDMTNPMSNSEMMNQMTQMATMNAMTQVSNAVSNFGIVTNNLAQVTLTSYSTSMIGKEVMIALTDEKNEVVGEKKGVVTGVDLTGGQYVYIGDEKYSLSQVMGVGKIPKKDDEEGSTEGADNSVETPDAEDEAK